MIRSAFGILVNAGVLVTPAIMALMVICRGASSKTQLPNVAFQCGFGGADGPVLGPSLVAAHAGHGVDPSTGDHELTLDEVLDPIHQAIGHDIQCHFQLFSAHIGLVGAVGYKRNQGAKCQ